MKIRIIAVGKLKEDYLKKGIAEYLKRLKSYVDIEIIEIIDEKAPENLSEKELEQVLEKEGQRILKKLPKDAYIISLSINAKELSSEQFAQKIKTFENKGVKNLVLIIGGSNGLSKTVLSLSDEEISFSKLTFPHQLMRIILAEQIYRAYRIINNHPYHK
ncbi:MAG: 23S rRNA (pseudouridine(1915)-N(3))-methyltransferase RlmH [Tissierellia bacterium]|nr:23S rRNA (pseudouridine(1915)-N(3))-methyltransferase RlmH [Tissierellia bacterium]